MTTENPKATENAVTDQTKPITDQEALAWIKNLSTEDQAELRRQALQRRALELTEPKPAPNFGAMTQAEFEAYKRSLGINS